jgi:hypothetical protein
VAVLGSWPSIRAHGLRSTTALLDLFEVAEAERAAIETRHRPEYVAISHPKYGRAWIRDQKPIDDAGLRRALSDTHLSNSDWYRLLNRNVFFWLTKERLHRMMSASAYRLSRHTVITIDTAALLGAHLEDVTLTNMNSGATKPMPHPRGPNTFKRLSDFPYDQIRTHRRPTDVIVELAVDYAVPLIAEYVLDVNELSAADLPH